MHTKELGNIGEMAAAKDLMLNGFHVFTELGDISKIDLIAEKDYNMYRIQCKCYKSINEETVSVYFKKSGPGYSFRYTEKDFDIMSVYVYDLNILFYVPSFYATTHGILTVRLTQPKNNQHRKITLVENCTLENALNTCKK